MAIALQFGSDEERPLYVGMATTLSTPATIIAPLVAGLLANEFGYPIAFATSALFGISAFIIFRFFVHEPQRTTA
jgi:MFS family permease